MRGRRNTLYLLGGTFFEWDVEKAASNVQKHGVSFEEAASVFGDEAARVYADPDHGDDESRFLLVGESGLGRLLVVASVERGERVRLISARRVTKRERRDYEEEA
ncbi:BrnT family toxin [Granulicella sp. dw_53]|uniref:BrnT family toxin n=1 Tax=Granulicella sp. dw_53 TaxID=2719792 RepID=UPI001BD41564|nr:BrnT family toxin [Granulicella sp. dw_53]